MLEIYGLKITVRNKNKPITVRMKIINLRKWLACNGNNEDNKLKTADFTFST